MTKSVCRVLVTGANGFVGKNLLVRMSELPNFVVSTFVRGDQVESLPGLVAQADAVVHLAGENRPQNDSAFGAVNAGLTVTLCDAIRNEVARTGRQLVMLLASSTQTEVDNAYGASKLAAEDAVQTLAADVGCPAVVFRLPGVFGKWSRPHYNSVVATFCHNIARELPIEITDRSTNLRLVYIDDVVNAFLDALASNSPGMATGLVEPEYTITLGQLADQIMAFNSCRGESLQAERVGTGVVRALYATYLSFMPNKNFTYKVPQYEDLRGRFVEVLKTPDSGQFSYFTALPGITRGGHYHHTKSEKFVVMKGHALFRFRHLLTRELYELRTTGDVPQVVDTIPGWAHDITNVGDDDLVVMLWANENFDREKPDTISSKV
jgi:UDP-2-acetamido-2,6-beta-L-arabino-hexul-4-ose reductase